ncbi:MAG: corrinoid protein [Defluviitaleaceae bacterium]|nr:corrinoid protein [Defluviitaleaceae bacterium]
MQLAKDLYNALSRGKQDETRELVQGALDGGMAAAEVLNGGMLAAMGVIGEEFKEGELYLPDVLIAARAMKAGMEILQPRLVEAGVGKIGKAAVGTVKGDQHDIGKNLVCIMFEGKGIEVMDLGTDVPPERFIEAADKEGATIIACSSLLTTTMNEMRTVVEMFEARGLRDNVTIMVGGAPITQAFCDEIGADFYTTDAASAAEVAAGVLKNG